jgi:membrane fusion protein, heavy metal efflux system
MKRIQRAWVLLFGMAITLFGCSKAEELKIPQRTSARIEGERIILNTDGQAPKSIVVERARVGVDRTLQLPGRLVWDEDRTVRVYSPFAGRVMEILVHPGSEVPIGQPLAMIASPDFGIAQAEFSKASADLALARRKLARLRELYKNGVSARKDLQEAEAEFARSQAEFERVSARIKLYGKAVHSVDQRYALKSPLAGVVVERAVNRGQELRPDQGDKPLFVISDPTSLWVQLDANEAELHGLSPDKPFTLLSSQYPGETFSAVITQVADYVDTVTRTIKIRGKVPNPERKLKAEMYVTAGISIAPGPEPVVPAKAVFLRGDKHFVFVSDGSSIYTRKAVTIGTEAQGMVSVLSGITPDEPIVVEGVLYLQQLLQSARSGA